MLQNSALPDHSPIPGPGKRTDIPPTPTPKLAPKPHARGGGVSSPAFPFSSLWQLCRIPGVTPGVTTLVSPFYTTTTPPHTFHIPPSQPSPPHRARPRRIPASPPRCAAPPRSRNRERPAPGRREGATETTCFSPLRAAVEARHGLDRHGERRGGGGMRG